MDVAIDLDSFEYRRHCLAVLEERHHKSLHWASMRWYRLAKLLRDVLAVDSTNEVDLRRKYNKLCS